MGIYSDCGHRTELISAGYGVVIVDKPVEELQSEVAGAVLMSGDDDAMAIVDDPRFVVLRHPVEDLDLADTGYSWSDLLWQGRYVTVSNMICHGCGTVFPRRRLSAPGATGCMPSLMLGVAVGGSFGIWWRSVSVGLITWYAFTFGAVVLMQTLASLYLRLRFSARAASLAAERFCPTCTADNAEKIDRAKRVTCPKCRHETLTFVMAGVS